MDQKESKQRMLCWTFIYNIVPEGEGAKKGRKTVSESKRDRGRMERRTKEKKGMYNWKLARLVMTENLTHI